MKKITRKLSTLILSLVAFAGIFAVTGVTAQAEPIFEKKVIVQLDRQKNASIPASIFIDNLTENDVLDKASVSSSKPGVASIKSICFTTTKDSSLYYNDLAEDNWQYSSARIELTVHKAGTSVISFKINGTTYKTTIKAYKYTNPIKTLKITGVKNGKNQVSRFKNKSTTNVTMKKNINNPILTITVKKNWKIIDINFNEFKLVKGMSEPMGYSSTGYFKGKNTVHIRLSTLKAKNSYHIMIGMQNKKTKGYLSCNYYINMKPF